MQHSEKKTNTSTITRCLAFVVGAVLLALLAACGTTVAPQDEVRPTEAEARSSQMQAFEAEAARVERAFVVASDKDASEGRYLTQAPQEKDTKNGRVEATLDLRTDAGSYTLWGRIYTRNRDTNAIYLGVDGKLTRAYTGRYKRYVWVDAGTFDLDAGDHRIGIGHAESEVRLDMVVLAPKGEMTPSKLDAWLADGGETDPQETAAPSAPEKDDSAAPTAAPRKGGSRNSLRGDPGFSSNSLPSDARTWYNRFWAGIDSPKSNANSWASSGNQYKYGRSLNIYISNMMMVFRATGDLRILDEIDGFTQRMRKELKDSGTNGAKDGFVNWRYYHKGDPAKYQGNDFHEMDEMLTHASVASVMYAYYLNRDLKSPSGVDYNERYKFWYDYLKNDFEAKWRKRNKKSSGFPFMNDNGLSHTISNAAAFHYYMYEVSGDKGYYNEAVRLANVINDNMFGVKSSMGDAVVWRHDVDGVNKAMKNPRQAQETTYVRYTVHAVMELALDGFAPYTSRGYETKIARTVASIMLDNGSSNMAGDVMGNKSMGGIPVTPSGEKRSSMTFMEPLAFMAAFDSSGRIQDIAEAVYDREEFYPEKPAEMDLPAAMVYSLLN